MVLIILIGVFVALIVSFVLVIQFPGLSDVVLTALDAIIYYIGQVMDIVWLFVPRTATILLGTLAISIEVVVSAYKFAMWVLRKIPVAGID